MPGFDEGADDFVELAKNLRLVGEDELHRELYQSINDAGRPVLGTIRRGLPDYMPDRYAAVLDSDLALGTTKRTGRDPGITIRGTTRGRGAQRRRLNRLEGGVLAHPLFGNRKRWFNQTDGVTRGWFTGPIEQDLPQLRAAIGDAIHRIAERATGRP